MKTDYKEKFTQWIDRIGQIGRKLINRPCRVWSWLAVKMEQPKVFFGVRMVGFVLLMIILLCLSPVILKPMLMAFKQTHFWHLKTNNEWLAAETETLNKDIKLLDNKLNSFVPKTPYIIINSTDNKFALYKGNVLIREGKCSTGSYLQLKSGENQSWLFKTPKGEFKIRNKKVDPVWKKPDWAFVEEGLPIPSPNHPSRYEYGVLGDYALSLGDGYMIHGTIWQRYLGLPVTHGCVRLNDADLEVVYKALSIGSKVYIF